MRFYQGGQEFLETKMEDKVHCLKFHYQIFNYPGCDFGKCTTSTLDERDKNIAHLYVLLNYSESSLTLSKFWKL